MSGREARGWTLRAVAYLSSISSQRPCLPIPCPHPQPSPLRICLSQGHRDPLEIPLLFGFAKAGLGVVVSPAERALRLSSSSPPPTPHAFTVNSHFCTWFEPGDVGSLSLSPSLCLPPSPSFLFVLASQLLEAWSTSRFDLGGAQDVFRQNAEDFKKTVLAPKGLGYTDPPVQEREGSVLQICEMGSSSNLPEEPWRD